MVPPAIYIATASASACMCLSSPPGTAVGEARPRYATVLRRQPRPLKSLTAKTETGTPPEGDTYVGDCEPRISEAGYRTRGRLSPFSDRETALKAARSREGPAGEPTLEIQSSRPPGEERRRRKVLGQSSIRRRLASRPSSKPSTLRKFCNAERVGKPITSGALVRTTHGCKGVAAAARTSP